jgi:hypothetical protein
MEVFGQHLLQATPFIGSIAGFIFMVYGDRQAFKKRRKRGETV